MRTTFLAALCAASLWAFPACGQTQSVEITQQLQAEEIDLVGFSEMLGYLLGQNLRRPGLPFELDALLVGVQKGYEGSEPPMAIEDYEQQLATVQEIAMQNTASENLKQAEAFLAENAAHPDTVEIEPGRLQYRILQEGTGATVAEGATPLIHYTGRYADGQVFDTSTNSDPIPLPLAQTIPGFSRGVAGMKEGEKRVIFVHPELGYGTSGPLQPNALIVFEVEVLKADATSSDDT